MPLEWAAIKQTRPVRLVSVPWTLYTHFWKPQTPVQLSIHTERGDETHSTASQRHALTPTRCYKRHVSHTVTQTDSQSGPQSLATCHHFSSTKANVWKKTPRARAFLSTPPVERGHRIKWSDGYATGFLHDLTRDNGTTGLEWAHQDTQTPRDMCVLLSHNTTQQKWKLAGC